MSLGLFSFLWNLVPGNDYQKMPPIHPALVHFPIALVTFAFVADLVAYLSTGRYWPRVGLAAFLTLGITVFQGWYGGELVYSQGAGVAAAGKGTEPPSAGFDRLSTVTRRLGGSVEETRGEVHE